MKITLLALLASILLVSVTNLLFNFGILGSPSTEYQAFSSLEMDKLGFRTLADTNGITIDESGAKQEPVIDNEIRIQFMDNKKKVVIDFPMDFTNDLMKTNLLPFTISTIEKDGWEFVSVTSDNQYIFRRR